MKYKLNYWALPGITVTLKCVREVVARSFGVASEDLSRKTRRREICVPRQVCISIGYTCLKIPGNECVREFNLANHATAIHSVKTIWNIYDTDKTFRTRIDSILLSLSINPQTWRSLE